LAEPYLSEIRLMSFGFPPKGWAFCEGQVLPINQNQALFALLGTTYGGDGRVNFALPDLRARVPMNMGSGHTLGERAGEDLHTLTIGEMPAHVHTVQASSAATGGSATPTGNYLGGANNVYRSPSGGSQTTLRPDAVTTVGATQPHQNQMPSLALNFCIALVGIFPSRN
jgi:microcystin-dependent protein